MVSALFGDTTSILAFICFVFDWRVYPCSSIVSIESLFIVGCIYSILILVVSFICPKLGLDSKIQNLVQQTNSLRMRDEVIAAILKTQLYHKVDITNSKILFGESTSKDMDNDFN